MEGISVVEGVSKAAQSIDLAAGLDERHFKIEEVLLSQSHYVFDKPTLMCYEATHFSEIPPALDARGDNWNFMRQGLFAEIGALWRSHDNYIKMWGFDTEGAEYEVDSPILFAEVVRPKHFIANYDFILVIATVADVSLHGIRKGPAFFQIEALPYKVPNDGPVTCIRGTSTGRIFIGTDDGSLLEFRYDEDADVTWFFRTPKKCAKHVIRSGSHLPHFLQRIFGRSTSGVRQIELDASRDLLYAITSDTVSVFNLEDTRYICDLSLTQTTRDLHPRVVPARTIVKIFPMSFSESEDLLLVGILSDGSRLFFRGFWQAASLKLMKVQAAFLRPSPVHNLAVLDAVSRQGVTLMCTSTGMTGISEDPKSFALRQSAGSGHRAFSEYVESMPLSPSTDHEPEAKVFALIESPEWRQTLPELASSATDPTRRRFICFTSRGLAVFSKNRPVDIMQHVLLEENEGLVRQFFQDYTPEQAAAMCFQIASNGSSLPRELKDVKASQRDQQRFAHSFTMAPSVVSGRSNASTSSRDGMMPPQSLHVNDSSGLAACVNKAESILFSPQNTLSITDQRERQMMPTNNNTQNPLGFIVRDTSRESPRIRGLYLYASRLLRPLWMHGILIPMASSNGKRSRNGAPITPVYGVRWSISERHGISGRLQRLSSLLQRAHSLRSLMPSEQEACHNVSLLIGKSIEAIEFLGMLRAPVENTDLHISFRDLVLTGGSRIVDISRLDLSQVAKTCPNLVTSGEAKVQTCMEMIDRIVKTREKRDDESACAIADRMMECLLDNVPIVHLATWGPLLRKAGCLKGLIELCVRKARLADPNNEAIKRANQQAHFARMLCYQVGLATFEDLKRSKITSHGCNQCETEVPRNLSVRSVVQASFSGYAEVLALLDMYLQWSLTVSMDELWHVCIFKWMLQEGRNVYALDSPYLLSFLHQPNHRELLCKYFHFRKSYTEATDAYVTMALTSSDPLSERQLSLDDRLSYLNTALTTSAGCTPNFALERRTQEILTIIECIKAQQVAKCELEDRISECGGYPEETSKLNDALKKVQNVVLNAVTLENEIARPYKLYETRIALRHRRNIVDSDKMVHLVRSLLKWRRNFGDLRLYFGRLWHRYGGGGQFLPLNTLCDLLVECAGEYGLQPQWVRNILDEARVPATLKSVALKNMADLPKITLHKEPADRSVSRSISPDSYSNSPSASSDRTIEAT